ncbi:MAG: hypothetical protein WD396_00320, partial [Pseudohongiellaceae bacterium]
MCLELVKRFYQLVVPIEWERGTGGRVWRERLGVWLCFGVGAGNYFCCRGLTGFLFVDYSGHM